MDSTIVGASFCDLLIHYKQLDQCFVSKYQCVFPCEYNKCGHIDGIDLLEMHVNVMSIHNVNQELKNEFQHIEIESLLELSTQP
jgi:hypothetical protein